MGNVKPLKGNYCSDCTKSLSLYQLTPGSIVPMCHEDLDQLLHNGDYELINKIVKPTLPDGKDDGNDPIGKMEAAYGHDRDKWPNDGKEEAK